MKVASFFPTVAFVLLALSSCGRKDRDSRFLAAFTENFDSPRPEYFSPKGNALRYYAGVHSFIEEDTDVMILRIDPSDAAGPGNGPEIATDKLTHFGTYSARIHVPDIAAVQPGIGMVTGFFTYLFSEGFGLSEIDFEWLMADPSLIYVGTWTSDPHDVNKLQRVGRTVNLATGEILYTKYHSYHDYLDYDRMFTVENVFDETDDAALSPRTIPAISGYSASRQFYVYGFDWYPDRLRWWVEHPETGEKVVLWDYSGSTPHFSGIPQSPTKFMLNFWHTENWSVDTRPGTVEAPRYPYMLEVDWIKYEPFEELNAEWLRNNDF